MRVKENADRVDMWRNCVVITFWQWTRRNWRVLLVIVAGGVLLSMIGCLKTAIERNRGITYLSKGTVGTPHAAFYLDTAQGLLERSQFPGQSDSCRMAYLALLAVTKGDLQAADQLVPRVLSPPRNWRGDPCLLVVIRAFYQAGAVERWFPILEQMEIPALRWYVVPARELETAGRLQQAEVLYRRAVALTPENVEAREALGSFLEYYRHDLPAAIAQYEVAVELDPSPERMLALVARYSTGGRFDEAAALINRVQTRFRGYGEPVAVALAKISYGRGDFEGTIRTLEVALQEFPDSPEIWHIIGSSYEALGQTQDALSAIRQAIALDPEWIWGYWKAADILLAHHRPVEAETYLIKMLALDIQGDWTEVLTLIGLGDAYVQMGRNDLALQSLCRAREINRWDYRAAYIEQQIEALGGMCDAK